MTLRPRPRVSAWLPGAVFASFIGLYFFHYYFIVKYAVDVPYLDEWDQLAPQALPAGFSLKWLFAQHNEHRIVTTNVLTWLLFKVNGWNIASQQYVSFLIYGVLLLVITRLARAVAPQLKLWVLCAFLLFLLSPINWQNHNWGFQTQFHFVTLFFFAAVYLLFRAHLSWRGTLLGVLMALLAAYSLSSGVAEIAVLWAMYIPFVWRRRAEAGRLPNAELARHGVVLGVIAAGLVVWTIGWHPTVFQSGSSPPSTPEFWDYFLKLVAFGFGFDSESVFAGLACLLIVILPLCGELRRQEPLPPQVWAITVATMGVLCTLATLAMGRAWLGLPVTASPRYAEFAMLLIPLAVMAWGIHLRDRPRAARWVLGGIWALCFCTFFNNWAQFSVYRDDWTRRTAGLECIKAYYATGFACHARYPPDLTPYLEEAKKLNLSFYANSRGRPINTAKVHGQPPDNIFGRPLTQPKTQ